MMRATLLLALAGCASAPAPTDVRFANAPAPQAVNDRKNVARPPREREFVRYMYNFDAQLQRPITRAFELHRHQRARGVNALDEVPDSTWFTNRIGTRDISPEELAAAPGGVGTPETHKPWTIVSTKAGGVSVGFIIKDARGKEFLIKFDQLGLPEAETATQVIMGKLMWGFGMNVTEDYIVYLDEGDLVLSPDAVIKDEFDHERPLGERELGDMLARVEHTPDGRLRVLASAWIDGKPLGPPPIEGVRSDDPNDVIPHELRRDLRGEYALFAWLDHYDIHPGNMLDVWTKDPVVANRHYVKHYWIDYGIGLGFGALKNQEPRYGYEHYIDFEGVLNNLLTFGAAPRAWQDRKLPNLRGVGLLETDLFDPGAWKSSTPGYIPIYIADRFDKFWASKIIMSFTRDQIRAVVDTARLSDPRAAAWLTERLVARQRKTARYWFERVNPLDGFAIDKQALCFKDLSIVYAFAPPGTTHYTLERYDRDGKRLSAVRFPAGNSGVTCVRTSLAAGGDGYTIARIITKRPSFTGATDVHLARDPTSGSPRVIGIWRL